MLKPTSNPSRLPKCKFLLCQCGLDVLMIWIPSQVSQVESLGTTHKSSVSFGNNGVPSIKLRFLINGFLLSEQILKRRTLFKY